MTTTALDNCLLVPDLDDLMAKVLTCLAYYSFILFPLASNQLIMWAFPFEQTVWMVFVCVLRFQIKVLWLFLSTILVCTHCVFCWTLPFFHKHLFLGLNMCTLTIFPLLSFGGLPDLSMACLITSNYFQSSMCKFNIMKLMITQQLMISI